MTSDNTAPELPLRRSRRNVAAPVAGDSKPEQTRRDASDEFAAAAQALNFTSETASQSIAPALRRAAAAQRQAEKLERRAHMLNTPFRKFAAATASVAAAGAIAAIVVGVVLPFASPATAESEISAEAPEAQKVDETQLQGYVAGSSAEATTLDQVTGYEASTYRNLEAVAGINPAGAFYENDITADIQYPFAIGTSMSSGFGGRWGRMHEGIDFTPGLGAPIQAIADGVVTSATEAGGAYGVNIRIEHVIDGKVVESHYAHMINGSMKVQVGDQVHVGQVIGNTGNTGRSTGPHTHFEIRYNGTAVDPAPWLAEHAGTHYSKEERATQEQLETQLLGQDFTDFWKK